MSNPGDLFQEWRTADRAAHALEQALTRASMAALERHGEAPSESERDTARKMRATADDLFQLAMAEMKSRADAARR
jgi:hypothetical protein